MFYLTTHIFIYGYMVPHMVKDHSDSERGSLLLPLYGHPGSLAGPGPDVWLLHISVRFGP